MPWVDAVGPCVVAAQREHISVHELGWRRDLTLEIAAEPGCRRLLLHTTDGQALEVRSARILTAHAGDHRLVPERLEHLPVSPSGARTVVVHLEDLAQGGSASLQLRLDDHRPSDLVWTPAAASVGHVEWRVSRGIVVQTALTQEGPWWWRQDARVDDPSARATLSHPWAREVSPTGAFTERQGLDAAAARALLDELPLVDRAWFGPAPVTGDPALQLGVIDDRADARTLASLSRGGPDRVEVGRFTVGAADVPGPDAPEIAVAWRDGSATPLPHGGWSGPDGFVHLGELAFPLAGQPGEAGQDPWEGAVSLIQVLASPGDPATKLLPQAGAEVRYTLHLERAEGDHASHALFLPLPLSATQVSGGPGPLRVEPGAAWAIFSAADPDFTLTWSQPLDEMWGDLPAGAPAASAMAGWRTEQAGGESIEPCGEVRTDHHSWWLSSFGDKALLTDRSRLLHALDARRYGASFPEPALPLGSRGRLAGWELAASLPALLRERAAIADLALSSARPRPLYQARRTGLVTEAEAAAIVALYAGQGRIQADVVLTGAEADPEAMVPRGYDHALVRLTLGEETRWLDPGCEGCAPFTLRAELYDRPALGVVERTPAAP